MFISKKDLGDLKSKAGATSMLQSQIAKLTNEFNAVQKELNFDENFTELDYWIATINGIALPNTTLKTVIKELTNRLSEQEKMTRMILAHLGIEYAKTTEETKSGKVEKEVLRKIKTTIKK